MSKTNSINDDNESVWSEDNSINDDNESVWSEDNSNKEMMDCLYIVEDLFDEIGVRFYHDWSCCMSCGHAEAQAEGSKNYVFYHEQATDSLKEGVKEVHLAFLFTDEMKPKVLEMIKENSDTIQWAGNDHTTIYVTCDAELMKKQVIDDEKRQKFMNSK